jgi:hypothetical protein
MDDELESVCELLVAVAGGTELKKASSGDGYQRNDGVAVLASDVLNLLRRGQLRPLREDQASVLVLTLEGREIAGLPRDQMMTLLSR